MASLSLGGLVNGIDFNALIDALVQLEQLPITQIQDKQTALNNRKDMYNEVFTALKSVQTAAQNLAKPAGMSFTASSSGNTDLVTASSTSSAAVGTYNVVVENLATATRTGSGFATQLGISANADLNQNLNLAAANLGTAITNGYITINGTQVAVNIDTADPSNVATNDTLQEVIDRINSTVSGVTASYDGATDTLKLSSAAAITVGSPDDTSNVLQVTGLLNSLDTLNGPNHERVGTHRLGRVNTTAELSSNTFGTTLGASGTFKINGVSIAWTAGTDSLNDVISRINAQVSTVVASYDAQTDKILLASRSTGSLGITVSDTTGNFLAATGLLANTGESQSVITAGQNAQLTIEGFNNGNPIYSTSNTVTDVVPGLTLNLQNADPTTTVAVSVTRDASDLKERIQSFVTAYNSVAQLISTRLTEEPVKNPTGSTTLAKVGLLRGDSLLSQMRSQLSVALTDVVAGLPLGLNRLGNLGVTIDKNNVKVGTLAFDETIFNAAVETNFQQTYDVLFDDTDGDGKIDTGENGVMPRLLDRLNKLIDATTQNFNGRAMPLGTLNLRIATLAQQSTDYDDQIEHLQDRLSARALTLRAKYLAAEQAIANLQAAVGNLGTSTSASTSSFSLYG